MEAKVGFGDIWGCSMVPAKLAFFSSKDNEQRLKNAACARQLFLTSPTLVFKMENLSFFFFFVILPHPITVSSLLKASLQVCSSVCNLTVSHWSGYVRMGMVLVKPILSLPGFESLAQLTDQKTSELSWCLVSVTSLHSVSNGSGETST